MARRVREKAPNVDKPTVGGSIPSSEGLVSRISKASFDELGARVEQEERIKINPYNDSFKSYLNTINELDEVFKASQPKVKPSTPDEAYAPEEKPKTDISVDISGGGYIFKDQNGDVVYQSLPTSTYYKSDDKIGIDPVGVDPLFEEDQPFDGGVPYETDEAKPISSEANKKYRGSGIYGQATTSFSFKAALWQAEKPVGRVSSNNIDLFSKTMTTRCILSDDKHNIYYIRCPKDTDLTDREIVDLASRGSDNNYQYLDDLPRSLKKSKEKPIVVKKKQAPKRDIISGTDFALKTNKFFDKVTSLEVFLSLIQRRISTAQFMANLTDSTCMKNVLITNVAIAEFGSTTGRVINHQVEVIGLNSTPHGNNYSSKASFRKFFIPEISLSVLDQNNFDKLFRFKIIGALDSAKAFGGKTAKLKFKGLICPADSIHYGGQRDLGEGTAHTFDFREPVSGNNLRFLSSEVEILALNSKYINSAANKAERRIEKGKQVIVIDDRKTTLNRGDIVKVTNVTKDASNVKNSILTVMDAKKNKHNILLKQTKVYGNQTVVKKEDNIIEF